MRNTVRRKLTSLFTKEEIREIYFLLQKEKVLWQVPKVLNQCKYCENYFYTKKEKRLYCKPRCEKCDRDIEVKCLVCSKEFKPSSRKGRTPSICSLECEKKRYREKQKIYQRNYKKKKLSYEKLEFA